MPGTRWMQGRVTTGRIAHAILGIILILLLTGLWAYLWVPPTPIF